MITVRFDFRHSRFSTYTILRDGVEIYTITSMYRSATSVFDAVNYKKYVISLDEAEKIYKQIR